MTDTTTEQIEFAELEPGIHRGQFMGVEDFEYTDKTTGEQEYRWRWSILMPNGTIEDVLTTRSFKPGTNALKFFTGLLGRAPIKGDRPNDRIGQDVDFVYGLNKGGSLKIIDIYGVKGSVPAASPISTPATPTPLPGESLAAAPVNQPMTTLPVQPGNFDGAPTTPAQTASDDLPF